MRCILTFTALLFAGPALAGPALERIAVDPPAIELTGVRDRQNIVVQAFLADGSTRDVTDVATFSLDKPLASVTAGQLAPLADGKAALTVSFEGKSATVPVTVANAGAAEPLRFVADVMPIFTRAGCNTGKCHGSASGKDGFRLSLFGYDPEGDHNRLTRESVGRRVNLASPEDSLLLNKALGKVPHTGGAKVAADSESHMILLRWLESGAAKDPTDAPRPVSIEVFPKEIVLPRKGEAHRMLVRAKYSDGTDRDVTRFSVFIGSNDGAAAADADGRITATGPGEAYILARFEEFVAGVPVIVRPGTPFTAASETPDAEIDKLVAAKLAKMHVDSSGICTDEVFLRRATIDLVGQLPTPAERVAFLADTSVDKRAKLVDALIARPAFKDIWVMKHAEMLQVRTANGLTPKGLHLYDQWLRERIRGGATVDVLLKELLPASGGTFDNPAVHYYQTETAPQLMAENVAQVFLGTRIQCAQCHNHPFDRWTMGDYYGFAAFFGQVGYKIGLDPRELTVYNAGAGETPHPVDGNPVAPKFLGGERPALPEGKDRRALLAEWLADGGNERFARNYANVVWGHFFPKGIVEPIDDSRASNPPSNPELLAYLGKRAAETKFDVAKLAKEICLSRTYQRSTQPTSGNKWDERNFARQGVRRMRAEVLLDCISRVTETQDNFNGVPAGGKAIEVPDGRTPNYFLTTFGRSTRATACTCETKTSPTLSQALHLLNGDTTNGKIAEGKVVKKLLDSGLAPPAVAEELYVRCLGRAPTGTEAERISAKLAASSDPEKSLNDLFWAILNTNEFLFNR